MRKWLALAAGAAVFLGCTVDTELGVAATINAASVQVAGTGGDTVVSVDMTVAFRVGEHATGERTFAPVRVDLYAAGAFAASVVLDRPDGFDDSLGPGESATVELHGETASGAYPEAAGVLCADEALVDAVLRWDDRTTDEVSTTMASTRDVHCT